MSLKWQLALFIRLQTKFCGSNNMNIINKFHNEVVYFVYFIANYIS